MKCPCEDCLMIPICRHKTIYEIYESCNPIVKYLDLQTKLHGVMVDGIRIIQNIKCLMKCLEVKWRGGQRC